MPTDYIRARPNERRIATIIAAVTAFAWLVTLVSVYARIISSDLGPDPSAGQVINVSPSLARALRAWSPIVLFPLTVLSLALYEKQLSGMTRRLAVLGDISYSTYLLHFPLQLAFALVIGPAAAASGLYYSWEFMVMFFIVLLCLAYASFHWFERPAQRVLRQTLAKTVSREPIAT